jgi:hypothetical protein
MKIRAGGDLGDCVFTLALLKALGGKHALLLVDRPPIKIVQRAPLLKRLFEAQSYVSRMVCSEEEPDADLTQFRRWHGPTTTLISAQGTELRFNTGEDKPQVDGSEPWITVKKAKGFKDKIIIARSPRYNNPRFPWKAIVEHYGKRLVFVGLAAEHDTFKRSFGEVPHLQCKDFMEMAQVIAGAALFIGNQSSPHAVALALGVPMISEVCDAQPDCVYPRDNVQYVCDGSCTLINVSGSGEAKTSAVPDIPESYNTAMVPPGMWQYPDIPPCSHFALQRNMVIQLERCTAEEAEKRLFYHNVLRVPDFFNGTVTDPMGLFKRAYLNAFPVKDSATHSETTRVS